MVLVSGALVCTWMLNAGDRNLISPVYGFRERSSGSQGTGEAANREVSRASGVR
jgi:hypothetical protein